MAAAYSVASATPLYTFVVEIPAETTAKMEVQKSHWYNPIMQDTNKDGSARYYTYGVPFFNYGLLPQTWEDPALKSAEGYGGDNDPLDVIEVGDGPLPMGSTTPVVVLGSLELIDEGETDHKIIALRASDPRASSVRSLDDLERSSPGLTARLVDWLKMYKTSDGKPPNEYGLNGEPIDAAAALAVAAETHALWGGAGRARCARRRPPGSSSWRVAMCAAAQMPLLWALAAAVSARSSSAAGLRAAMGSCLCTRPFWLPSNQKANLVALPQRAPQDCRRHAP